MIEALLEVKKEQLDALQKGIKRLEEFKIVGQPKTIKLTTADVQNPAEVNYLASTIPRTGSCLYFFETSTPDLVIQDFRTFQADCIANNISPSISRFHNLPYSSTVLYVGSSKGLRERFKQHCGYYQGKNRTFGLKFGRWLKNAEVQITFWYLQLPSIDSETLQRLEDGLHQKWMPNFGKRGGA